MMRTRTSNRAVYGMTCTAAAPFTFTLALQIAIADALPGLRAESNPDAESMLATAVSLIFQNHGADGDSQALACRRIVSPTLSVTFEGLTTTTVRHPLSGTVGIGGKRTGSPHASAATPNSAAANFNIV